MGEHDPISTRSSHAHSQVNQMLQVYSDLIYHQRQATQLSTTTFFKQPAASPTAVVVVLPEICNSARKSIGVIYLPYASLTFIA